MGLRLHEPARSRAGEARFVQAVRFASGRVERVASRVRVWSAADWAAEPEPRPEAIEASNGCRFLLLPGDN